MSAADVRLKSFIDRVLRHHVEYDWQLATAIEDRLARLDYALTPLAQIGEFSTVASDRAVSAAGKLLGVKNDTVRNRAQMIRRRGGLSAALAQLQKWFPGEDPWPVPALDGDLIGLVYLMEAVDFPGIIKIGFSRSPKQRLRRLQRQHKITLRLVHSAPGTELDEHLVQHSMEWCRLANEWFDLDGRWRDADPTIRFYTPDRMWNELRAHGCRKALEAADHEVAA